MSIFSFSLMSTEQSGMVNEQASPYFINQEDHARLQSHHSTTSFWKFHLPSKTTNFKKCVGNQTTLHKTLFMIIYSKEQNKAQKRSVSKMIVLYSPLRYPTFVYCS